MSHLTHMPLGTSNCCGVIELFPNSEWTPARGHGNMARKLGFLYDRIDFKSLKDSPSTVPVSILVDVVSKFIKVLKVNPSCVLPSVLNDFYFKKLGLGLWRS